LTKGKNFVAYFFGNIPRVADYEQLLRPVFSCFHGQKKISKTLKILHKLHKMKVKKIKKLSLEINYEF
jgi:hypothetical protein